MPNPTPIYRIKVNNDFLPGYAQTGSSPFTRRTYMQDIINRDGGLLSSLGANIRKLQITMLLRTELDVNATGLQHHENVLEQYQTAVAIVNRQTGLLHVRVGEQGKFFKGILESIDAAEEARSARRLVYTVVFNVLPYLFGTEVTNTFSANGAFSLTLPTTATTYPAFTIPSTVTAFTAVHSASGKTLQFARGAFGSTIIVDCATMTTLEGATDASRTMDNVNFGIRHTSGAGSFSLTISGYAGSGNVTVGVFPRTEVNV